MVLKTRKALLVCGTALAALGLASAAQAQQQTSAKADSALPEVVVTATKRPEAVRKMSGSVTAVTGQDMEKIGAQSLEDYVTFVPGVEFNAAIPGLSTVVLRGVSSTTAIDQGQGTTGYFINDVPLTDPYFSVAIPDIDTFDVDSVAVLRGPQGTLFGSASLGGAINYQAAKPDLTHYDARVQGTVEDTEHGGVGGAGKVMINLPLVSDVFALRGVFIYRNDAGYIDNIGAGEKDANSTVSRGGRIEATWRLTPSTTLNYLFLDQSEDTRDNGYQEPVYAGLLEKKTLIPEPANFRTLIHNLRLDQNLGFATLTATATYHEKSQYSNADETSFFGALLPGVSPIQGPQTAWSRGTTVEVRLASPIGQRFEYLVGAMHDFTREYFDDTFEGANAAQVIESVYSGIFGAGIGQKAAPGGVFFYGLLPFRGDESAIFGEATYHFNDQWKLTLGGREFQTTSNNTSIEGGFFDLLTSGQLQSVLKGKQSDTGFNPKASLTWTPNNDFMVYGLVSKGFRFGGPNINPSEPGAPIPPTFASDSLYNYEVGTRTNWLDRRLQLDATVFFIDWSNIQLRLATPTGLAYAANAGSAHNYGFEGTSTWRIAPDLTLQTNLTYLQAELASTFNPGAGGAIEPSGTELPGTAHWQVSNVLTYRWRDGPGNPLFVLSERYISHRPGNFTGGEPTAGYITGDARTTFTLRRNLDVTLFVQNLGDTRGVTSASNFPGEIPLEQYLIRPRTFGVTLDYRM